MKKVLCIEEMYCVELDGYQDSECFGKIPMSVTIVRIFDDETREAYYSEWRGTTNMSDLLPNGSLYLADDFEEAVKKLNDRIK